MLSRAWSDGHSLIPMWLENLSNADKQKHIGANPDYDGRTRFGKRCRGLIKKTVDVASKLLKLVGMKGEYLVFKSLVLFPIQAPALTHCLFTGGVYAQTIFLIVPIL